MVPTRVYEACRTLHDSTACIMYPRGTTACSGRSHTGNRLTEVIQHVGEVEMFTYFPHVVPYMTPSLANIERYPPSSCHRRVCWSSTGMAGIERGLRETRATSSDGHTQNQGSRTTSSYHRESGARGRCARSSRPSDGDVRKPFTRRYQRLRQHTSSNEVRKQGKHTTS